MDVLPASAAAGAGLRAGDRMVEMAEGAGSFVPLYNTDLSEVVKLLHGEAGQTARVRILRTDAAGRTSESVVNLTRQQLVFQPPKE